MTVTVERGRNGVGATVEWCKDDCITANQPHEDDCRTGKDGLRLTAERGNDEDDLETNKDYKTV